MSYELTRNAFGRLVLTDDEGNRHEGVLPVRAFPITAPEAGIAVVNAEGHEVAWIDRLEDLPTQIADLLKEELASREFMPQIQRIKGVSSFATPSTWDVVTDRGEASFVLKGEEDLRRLGQTTLIVADSHGIQYLIRDITVLDKTGRRILDRFL
jgi:hypothetical protein